MITWVYQSSACVSLSDRETSVAVIHAKPRKTKRKSQKLFAMYLRGISTNTVVLRSR